MYYDTCFSMHGTNLVLDVSSGAVHVFDDTAFEVLKCFDQDGRLNDENCTNSKNNCHRRDSGSG